MSPGERNGVSGKPDPVAVLFIPGKADNGGFLWFLPVGGGKAPCVRVRGVFVRLLIALNDAKKTDADAGLPGPARGWRRPETLAKAIAGDDLPVEAETVRKYLSAIQKAAKEAFEFENQAAAAKAPPLIERRRGLGARLGVDKLEIRYE